MELQEGAFEEPFFVSSITFQELESIKTSAHKSEHTKYQARNLLRLFSQNNNFTVIVAITRHYESLEKFSLPITNDNLIIAGALSIQSHGDKIENGSEPISMIDAVTKKPVLGNGIPITFITNDFACLLTARYCGLKAELAAVKSRADYYGYKEVVMTDNELGEFYTNLSENHFGLLVNEYLIIRNPDGEVIDRRKWNGGMHDVLRYKQIANDYTGRIKPRNPQQDLCFDMLQDPNTPIKIITGKFGTGKDFLMVSHALQSVIKSGKFEKIIWVRNNVEVKDSRQIGFLPGSQNDKLMPFAQIIADHVGGQDGLDLLISQGRVELCHLGFLRGRDIKNSIIYCSEAENLTKQHVQLLMGRVGEGSQLWMNGDFKQVDSCVFEQNSGLLTTIDCLKGNGNFGFVNLVKSERSEVASMADLLD